MRNIAKNKDILCLWIDCEECENICYEIIHNILPFMNKKKYQQVYRTTFLSLANTDINNSFDFLEEYPYCELLMSVDARAIIDYKVGISFNKLLTYEILDYIDEKSISDKKVLSYGLCKTMILCKKEKGNR